MLEKNDMEYLARPLQDGINFTIQNDYVKITSEHTVYVERRRINPIVKKDILSIYKTILRKAKENCVSISYRRHFRKTINEQWHAYDEGCKNASDLFDLIIEQAKIVEQRGIHFGTIDDIELDKLTKLCHKHLEFFWRSNVVSQITEIFGDLKQLEKDLTGMTDSRKIYQIYI